MAQRMPHSAAPEVQAAHAPQQARFPGQPDSSEAPRQMQAAMPPTEPPRPVVFRDWAAI